MKYTSRASIRLQLLLLVSISVLPVLALVLYAGLQGLHEDVSTVRARTLGAVLNMAHEQERVVESTRQLLAIVAMLPEVQRGEARACSAIFRGLLKESPQYSNLFLANADGIIIADRFSPDSHLILNMPLFRDARRTGRLVAGQYHLGRSGRPTIAFGYPVFGARGRFLGLVAAAYDLGAYGRMLKAGRLPRGWVLSISDRNNVRLYRSPDKPRYAGKADPPEMTARLRATPSEGTFFSVDPDGVRRIYAYTRLSLEGSATPYLYMRVGVPEKAALQAARANLARSLALLCLALAVALASAWLIGQRLILRRLRVLADASGRLAQGDLTARTGLVFHRPDELGQVTKAFDAMAEELERRDTYAALASEALARSEEKYRHIFENAFDGIFQSTPEGRYLSANQALARMYGYESAGDLLVNVTDMWRQVFVDAKARERLAEALMRDGFIEGLETECYRKDGTKVRVSTNARAVRDGDGKVLYYEGTTQDITERKRAEEALLESEEKFRLLFEKSADPVLLVAHGKIVDCNEAALKMLKCPGKDRLIGLHPYDVSPEWQPNGRLSSHLSREIGKTTGVKGVNRFEWLHRDFDRRDFWVEVSQTVIPIGGRQIIYIVWRDIGERKRAEEALRAAHRQVLDIIEFFPDATMAVDGERKVIAWNRAMEELTGIGKEDMLGKGDYEYAVPIHGEARPIVLDLFFEGDQEVRKHYGTIRKEGNVLSTELYVHIASRGRDAYLAVNASPLFDGTGGIVGAISSVRDLTEQKHIEEALRESEERYRTVIEKSNDGIAILKDGKHIYANRKLLDFYGLDTVDQVVGREANFAVHPDDRERVAEIHRRKLRNEGAVDRYEIKGVRADGEVVFVEISAVQTTYRGEAVTLAFLRDVTARKSLEAQLLHAQKMEAIGTLAGGVAHDFNNILMTLMGYGNLLQMKMAEHDPLRVYVDQMLSATAKAANLTQSLLTFGRKQVIELKAQKLSPLVKDMEKLLRRLLPEDIELWLDLGEDITVMADMTQIDQVLMNLATNARDAMPGGGTLTITTGRADIDGDFKRTHGFGKMGRYALLSVKDTGTGMDEKTKQKIFEPFFTTKEVGKGTGLGLSIVFGIVKQHGGYITVESEKGQGAVFRIYLPAIDAKTAETKPVSIVPAGGVETILFAEDDPDIRRMASHILTMSGYTVIEAQDGEDAVRRFRESGDAIDLLVFDVVMPVKNGKEAYEEIRAIRKDARVLFVSGYTRDVVIDKGLSEDSVDYVSKPLTPEGLLTKVRDVLDGKRDGSASRPAAPLM